MSIKSVAFYLSIMYAWATITGFLYLSGYLHTFGISLFEIELGLPFLALIAMIPVNSLIIIASWSFPGLLVGVVYFISLFVLSTYLYLRLLKTKGLKRVFLVAAIIPFILIVLLVVPIGNLAENLGLISKHNGLFFYYGFYRGGIVTLPFLIEFVLLKKLPRKVVDFVHVLSKYKVYYLILISFVLALETLGAQKEGIKSAIKLEPFITTVYKFDKPIVHEAPGRIFTLCKLSDTEEDIYYLFSNSSNMYFYNDTSKRTVIKKNSADLSLGCEEQEYSRERTRNEIDEALKSLDRYFNSR